MTTTTPICETASVKSSAALGDKVSSYWNTRAEGYSLRTADELNGPRGAHWQERLLSNLRGVPSGGSVLDVGCGPALLAIPLPDAAGKLMAATPALKCSGALLRMRRRPGLM